MFIIIIFNINQIFFILLFFIDKSIITRYKRILALALVLALIVKTFLIKTAILFFLLAPLE